MVDIKPEKLLLPEEVDIYEQGLKQDFDAGLIGRWIGKFEGVCDLSMRWESGDNDFYKDYLLDEVFDNCIRKLKKPGRVFGSVEAMNRYFTEHSEFMLNLKGRGWAYTFRILTNLFAFYFFFLPTDDENVTSLHFVLVYRGDKATADAYLKTQDDYLNSHKGQTPAIEENKEDVSEGEQNG